MHLEQEEVLPVQLGRSEVLRVDFEVLLVPFFLFSCALSVSKCFFEVLFVIFPRRFVFDFMLRFNGFEHELRRIFIVSTVFIIFVFVILDAEFVLSIQFFFLFCLVYMMMYSPGILLQIVMMVLVIIFWLLLRLDLQLYFWFHSFFFRPCPYDELECPSKR